MAQGLQTFWTIESARFPGRDALARNGYNTACVYGHYSGQGESALYGWRVVAERSGVGTEWHLETHRVYEPVRNFSEDCDFEAASGRVCAAWQALCDSVQLRNELWIGPHGVLS